MATILGTINLDSWNNYQLAYDLLGQNIAGNTSTVRLYGILNVNGNGVSWTRGTANVHTESQSVGTYYGKGTHILIQRDFTFSHDNQGNFNSYIGASLSTTYKSVSTGGNLVLPSIPRRANITSAINFTDEDNPKITFSNPGGFTLNVWLEPNPSGQHICVRNNISNTGSYTWNLTDDERKILRQKCKGNSCVVRIGLYTIIGNTTYSHYVDRTMTIKNGSPIFNNFEFEDINPKTLQLTGNKYSAVNGYSSLKITIPVENKAEAVKEATISKYRATTGENNSIDISFSDTQDVYGQLSNVNSSIINVYAIDSRNNSSLASKAINNFINYTSIIKDSINVSRNNNGVGEIVTLSYNGKFDNVDFGEVQNTIKSISYTLQRTDSNEVIVGTTNITPSIDKNKYSFTGIIFGDKEDGGFDIGSSYIIKVTIEDELSKETFIANLSAGIPNIAIAKGGVGIMGKYDTNVGGLLQVAGIPLEEIIKNVIEEMNT